MFPNLYKARRELLFAHFYCSLLRPCRLLDTVFAAAFFSRQVTLPFRSNISIAKVSSSPCLTTNCTVRLDQGSFFQVSLHLEGSSARLELSELHSHASYLVYFSPARASREIRLDNSGLTKVFVSCRAKLTATTTTARLNASPSSGSPKLGGFLTTAAVWERLNSVTPNTRRDMNHNNGRETPEALGARRLVWISVQSLDPASDAPSTILERSSSDPRVSRSSWGTLCNQSSSSTCEVR